MEDSKISIIIPMYNVGKYIRQCASSLFKQRYENMEFVFIDDYSTDNTIEELKSTISDYPERVSQTKLICNAVNKGIASTRNIGLDNITGDYIGWVDADDWVDTNMFGELANLLSTTNSEIAYCHYFIEGTHTEACIVGNLLSSDKECVLYNYFLKTDLHSLWNKLFRKSLFVDNNIRFLEGCNFCEDLNVTAKLIYCAKKICCLDNAYYHYRINSSSICHIDSREKLYGSFSNIVDIYDFLADKNKGKKLVCYLLMNSKLILLHKYKDITVLQIRPEANRYILSNPLIGIKGKFVAQIVCSLYSIIMWVLNHVKL